MLKIIDTASVKENDLIEFHLKGNEGVKITGVVDAHREDGMFNVSTAYGLIAVDASEITDIC